ncbi:MAG: T9SS type A sorting domain-containing protein [Ignavibacteria bacterium]|nr:T9SS type A sorting domain-containing protein [Ignavibacteria bacterium]
MKSSTSILKIKKGFIFLSLVISSVLFVTSFNVSQAQDFAALGSGLNGSVYAVTEFNGDLIVGGYFTLAGGTSANRIAKWDGSNWSELGSGLNGSVYALKVYNADLYAGGYFSTAGGAPANNIAKWNGTSWIPLGLGVNATVYALEVFTNALILGGSFTSAGGMSVNRIARWNGNWEVIGAGPNSSIYAMKVYNNQLFIGGTFTTVGGVTVNRITCWNGNNWFSVGSGIGNGYVYSLAEYNSALIVGGYFASAGGSSCSNIAAWDGSSWSSLGSGTSGGSGSVRALTTYLDNLYAGGYFSIAGGVSANRIAQWNGSAWSSLGNGMNGYVYTLGVHDATLIVGGYFTLAGTTPANRIAKWGSIPVAPVLISPPNVSTQVSLTPTLDWDGIQNAFDYGVQVSDEPNFNTTVVDVTGLSATEYQVPEGILNLNTVYFWRTNARNGMGTSPYSSIWYFTTTTVNVGLTSNEVPGEYKLYANYPNPFNPATKIKFDIPEKSFVKLTVYDALGREINTLVNNELTPGSYAAEWNGAGYSSGIYFYRVVADDFIETKKMSLIK